ncbi:hypothetical protein CWE11_08515 [Aliidiomarina sanyensis]|uniref:FAD-binding domain-containing protein n=1 Tax=Aliidiomarina sanyensis TaxID=1249555 RepID=A0A432WEQ0_9GAMM|nr:hypothetical protein CWE11_08515 [Aliidiomarina sanyensis]
MIVINAANGSLRHNRARYRFSNRILTVVQRTKPIVIVGGGMVGAAAALALAESGFSVDVLEPQPEAEYQPEEPYDLRISAVTADNIALLERLGIWEDLLQARHQVFHELAVKEQGGPWLEFGDANGPALGYMLENRVLQRALQQQCRRHPLVRFHNERFAALEHQSGGDNGTTEFVVRTASGTAIPYRALLGADGAQSPVRHALGLGTSGRTYREHCLLALVKMPQPVPARTWQIFAGDEVHALLPLAEHHACLIVYAAEPQLNGIKRLDSAGQQKALEQRFASEIGEFKLVKMGSFPLRHQQVLTPWSGQRAGGVIGDAAHAVHPLAGQGVNLGFRDVQAIFSAAGSANDETISDVLARTLMQRKLENNVMGHGLDGISRLFRSEHRGMVRLRRAAFALLASSRGPIPALRGWVGTFAGGRFTSK